MWARMSSKAARSLAVASGVTHLDHSEANRRQYRQGGGDVRDRRQIHTQILATRTLPVENQVGREKWH